MYGCGCWVRGVGFGALCKLWLDWMGLCEVQADHCPRAACLFLGWLAATNGLLLFQRFCDASFSDGFTVAKFLCSCTVQEPMSNVL